MHPGEYNFTIYQGADDGLTFTITDGVTPVDLTGYTAAMNIRKNADAAAPLVTATSTGVSPRINITPLTGEIAVTIPASATTSLPFKGTELECTYDIEITSPTGVISRVLMGDVTISREITR